MKTNYVDYSGSYCHYLKPKLSKLRRMAFSENVSFEQMKRAVGGIVKPAKWTGKKAEFMYMMNEEIADKRELYFYVKNSVSKAEKTIVEAN